MFLSKDFLDEGGPTPPPHEQLPAPPGPPAAPSHRPGTASGSSRGLGEEETEDLSTPTSAAMLRQKFLQQRQKTLQKQRTGGLTGMVQANQGLGAAGAGMSPAPRPPGPSRSLSTISSDAPPPPPPGGTAGYGELAPSAIHGLPDTGGSMSSPKSDDGNPLLKSVMDSMAADGEDMEGLVAPNPLTAEELKAEEARRRSSLAAALDEKGISTVFDPGAGSGPSGAMKPQFDVTSIPPGELKSFLLNPSPKPAGMIECRIIRDKGGLSKLFPKYILETDAGVFLMAAKKQKNNKTSKYVITMSKTDDSGKDEEAFLGKLRSNFLGLEFMAYGEGMNPKKIDSSMSQVHALQLTRQELLAVQYSSSLWGTKPRGPRKMGAVIPKVQPNGERLVCRTLHPDTEGLVALQKANNTSHIHTFHNKPPKWNEQVGAFVLNFNKRVTQASVKNFQLTTVDDPDTVFLQFGRVGKDVFNMDFRFPFSPFQAFAICLSSFDYKLCCE